MRQLKKNKQRLYYATNIGEVSLSTEEYVDVDGNRYPLEDGKLEQVYLNAEKFYANIAMSGGEAEAKEFGLSLSDYQATISYSRGNFPLQEGTLIWYESEVKNKYENDAEIKTDKGTYFTKCPIPTSADYMVLKINKSLNEEKAILKAVNK